MTQAQITVAVVKARFGTGRALSPATPLAFAAMPESRAARGQNGAADLIPISRTPYYRK
jgi:hypothetical protein